MIKIVGFQHKDGNFTDEKTGRNVVYDNIVLFYLSDCVKNVVGCSTGEIKVSFDQCKAVTGYDYAELPELLNKNVDLSYIPVGKYQQLSSIRVIDDGGKK